MIIIENIKKSISDVRLGLKQFKEKFAIAKIDNEVLVDLGNNLKEIEELIEQCNETTSRNTLREINIHLVNLTSYLILGSLSEVKVLNKLLKERLSELRVIIMSDDTTFKLKQSNKKHDELSQSLDNTQKELDKLKKEIKDIQDVAKNYEAEINKYQNATQERSKENLGADFYERFEFVSKKRFRGWWLAGAGLFLAATIFIGSIILFGLWFCKDVEIKYNDNVIVNLVGRLSMISITIMGAVFCANQYTKQKTLIEDYAYKTTIAKSILAFSKELREKSPEEYSRYIALVTKEIYQDPLRKRGKEKEELKKSKEDFTISEESLGLVEKIIKIAKIQDTNS